MKIKKEHFKLYEQVRKNEDREHKMFDIESVMKESGLNRETVEAIMADYKMLIHSFPELKYDDLIDQGA